MSQFSKFYDEIQEQVRISDIVKRYVRLTKKGREWQGLCPFHNEKTPSFTVNDEKEFYHCFGCGAHGGVINFVKEQEGMGFREAAERLAQEYHIEIPKFSPQEKEARKKEASLHDITEQATVWFEHNLSPAKKQYLIERGVNEETIRHFQLGFAPDSYDALQQFFAGKNVKPEVLHKVGLVSKNSSGKLYDKFRNRIIFPICNKKGQPIAFGGRVMEANVNPKYLNSPETEIFHKRRTLYALHLARKSIYDLGTAIITEGYMDVIAMHQAGFTHTVSTLGTAITEEHLGMLWHLVNEPIFCMDGDNAGKKAMHRVAYLALQHLRAGKSVRFAFLPKGFDPDDLIKEKGRGAMEEVLSRAIPLVDAVWNIEREKVTSDTPEQKADFENRMYALVENIPDATVKKYYSDTFNNRLWDERRARKGKKKLNTSGTYYSGRSQTMPISAVKNKQEEAIVFTLLNHPELLHYRDVEEVLAHVAHEEFKTPALTKIADIIIAEENVSARIKELGLESYLQSAALYKDEGELHELYARWKLRIDALHESAYKQTSKREIIKDDISEDEWQAYVEQFKEE